MKKALSFFLIITLCFTTLSGLMHHNANSSLINDKVIKDSLKVKRGQAKNIAVDSVKGATVPAIVKDSVQVIKENTNGGHNAGVMKVYSTNIDTIKQFGKAFRVQFHGKLYDYVVVDLSKSDVQLHWKDKDGKKYNSINALLKDTAILKPGSVDLITNGGMYTSTHDPQGLYIENKKEYKGIDTLRLNSGENFYLKPNGVFFIDTAAHITTTEEFVKKNRSLIQIATQSGPMLVIDNKIHPVFKEGSENTNIRSGVGLVSDYKIVFAISVGQTNFYDFAELFKSYLKCSNALYLDGAISKMYIPGIREGDTGGDFGPIISVTPKAKN